MSRPKRKAAVECEEKLHKVLKQRKRIISNLKSKPDITPKTRSCSVKISKNDSIPSSMLKNHFTNRCYIKMSKADIPVIDINPNITKSQKDSEVKANRDESIYDFVQCSESSQSSDGSMKELIKKLQSKGKVRVVKSRQKGKHAKDLIKPWKEIDIKRARKYIKPKVSKPTEISIIEVVQNKTIKPLEKSPALKSYNQNNSILPTIQDINDDDDHFINDDHNFTNDENLYNSNAENINPNSSLSNKNILQVKPMVRSPLKPLNNKFIRTEPSPKIQTPLRNLLLKRLSLNKQPITSPITSNKARQLQKIDCLIEDANVTNYFGFTSDLTSESSFKNSSDHTSTPLRTTTASKESLIEKLKMLKSSAIISSPRVSKRPKRQIVKTFKQTTKEWQEGSINFAEALSSTLVQPTITRKKTIRRTYSRHQNIVDNNINESNLFDNIIGEPVEKIRNILLDDKTETVQKKSPTKKALVKVYGNYKFPPPKQNIQENPELLSFYESFNTECEMVDQFNIIVE